MDIKMIIVSDKSVMTYCKINSNQYHYYISNDAYFTPVHATTKYLLQYYQSNIVHCSKSANEANFKNIYNITNFFLGFRYYFCYT